MSRATRLTAIAAATVLLVAAIAAARPAQAGAKSPTGYDISYPQCGTAFPSSVQFGIVGVNRGIVFSANPCLGGAGGELAWAERYESVAILYANTGNPGPALSSHWPRGQTSPQSCDGSDSGACAYDYGWNAAADSYADAVNAYVSLGKLPAGATQTPNANEWWLDVETANSWESNTAHNVAELQGEVAFLQSKGVRSIGFYSSASDWQTITGTTTAFAAFASWRPGAGTRRTAQSYCGAKGVTGGPIKYSQYRSSGLDADVRCF